MLNCPRCEQVLTPHEIGVLRAAVGNTENRTARRYWGVKLTRQDVIVIRELKEPIKQTAEKHNVSISTISKIRNNRTYKDPGELRCPHCGHELTSAVINSLFATLGGVNMTPKRMKTYIARRGKSSKLTDEEVADIRVSKASNRELARKYNVLLETIRRIRRTKP